jgi:hypothetical protein
MFEGILIQESVRDSSVIDRLKVVRTEIHHPENATAEQSKVWTLIHFEAGDDKADEIATLLADNLKNGPWYTNFTTQSENVYVVFPGQFFTYQVGNKEGRGEAQAYGRSVGIPLDQLDWSE